MVTISKMTGSFMYSDNNKMGIFIVALNKKKEEEIYDTATKAYENWMCCENDSEDWTIGDWMIGQLTIAGFEKEEDYYMFYDSDWN